MPKSTMHAIRRKKNLTVLGILVGIVAGFFCLTIVKMQGM